MYNQEQKNRFLEQYDEETVKIYKDSLMQIDEMEEFYNKDIFNFTYEQLDTTFKGIRAKTLAGVRRISSPITKYIDWANQQGFVKTKISYTKLFSGKKLEEYVWSYAFNNSYIDREKLYILCSDLENSVDKAILVLAFEGIDGKEHFEMRNLKKTDIDFNTGKINMINIDGKIREIIINDKRSLNIIQDAINQDIYKFANGESTSKRFKEEILENMPYVIRKIERPNSQQIDVEDGRVSSNYLSGKANKFFKGVKNALTGKYKEEPFLSDCMFLNLNNIFKSGFFDYCMSLEKEKDILITDDYKNACERYGINPKILQSYKQQYLDWKEKNKQGE